MKTIVKFGCKNCGSPHVRELEGKLHCASCGSVFDLLDETAEQRDARILYLERLDDAEKCLRVSPPHFDEAEDYFRDFIKHYPDNSDGYWGLVRARYGIKYEDRIDGTQIPSCYKSEYVDFRKDVDYLQALKLAESEKLRQKYQNEGQLIAQVCAAWKKETEKDKYDIFISFKHTENATGEKTEDYYEMLKLYTHLVTKGYRVFFSPESMKNYTGLHYDAYIFNALHTAKVMIVYGSKAEYFESTWVKNEWTRFERLVESEKKDKNALIVVYNGFSPYQLPHSLRSIQSINAADNWGFYSDLDAHIEKVIKPKAPVPAEPAAPVATPAPQPTPTTPQREEKKPKKRGGFAVFVLILLLVGVAAFFGPELYNRYLDYSQGNRVLTDGASGITVSLDEGSFGSEVSLDVKLIEVDEEMRQIIKTLPINQENYRVYDISLKNGNEVTSLHGQATVSMRIPGGINAEKSVIYYIGNGSSQLMNSSVNDNVISFKTNHFSIYIFGEKLENHISPEPEKDVTITYHANGGSGAMTPTVAKEGENISLPACSFTKNGYEFVGWALSSGEHVTYVDQASLKVGTSDITLYAVWEKNTVTISFNSGGGQGTMNPMSVKEGESISLPACSFTKNGYEFVGWATSSGGTPIYVDQATYTAGSTNVTLYAVWGKEAVTISFKPGGGQGSMTAISAVVGSDVSLPKCNFTKSGYKFVGWATSSGGHVTYVDQASLKVGTSDITLYAVWEVLTATVKFAANGGSGYMPDQTLYGDRDNYLKACTFTRNGYEFVGWAGSPSGNAVLSDGEKITGNSIDSATLYAVWSPVSITMIFDATGGSSSFDAKGITFGREVGDLPVATRDYYEFEGWYTAENGGMKITSGFVYDGVSPLIVYAHWSLKETSWVRADQLPTGAQVVDRKWTYTKTETTESSSSSISGWTQTGSYWKEVDSGSSEYASFPTGYLTSHSFYTSMNKSPYESYEYENSKREVVNEWAGYIYWHYMYNTSANAYYRCIRDEAGTASNYNDYYYSNTYFRAFKDKTDYQKLDKYYQFSGGTTLVSCGKHGYSTYLAKYGKSNSETSGSCFWYRFNYYTTTYTDYEKVYTFKKVTNNLESETLISGAGISNVVEWVEYRAK